MLRDQDEIGAAVKPFYGDEAGTKLTQLLRTHITQAADLLTAANADDIAASLSQANPESWPADQVKAMMHMHLDQTISEATNRLKGNYTAEIADSDATENHILTLADTLSSGLVAQFPDKFRA